MFFARSPGMAAAAALLILFTGTSAAFAAFAPTGPSTRSGRPPDFSGIWIRAWKQSQLFDPPDSGPGPVVGDSAYPHTPGHPNDPWVADLSNPILRPATRAKLKAIGEGEVAGSPLLKNDTLCLPLGIAAALNVFDEMQVLQTPTQVIFLYARDHQVRFVKLDKGHGKIATQTWYGDSVGHYEEDTLVVDTIGMNDKTIIDRFGTPHSDTLHIVERYRLTPDRTRLQATVTFEDLVVFTAPWSARLDYGHDPGSPLFEEIICAENNRASGPQHPISIPTAAKPDF